MSLASSQSTDGSNPGSIFVQFNQDCTSLVAGSAVGYHLFSITQDDNVEEIYASKTGTETCLVDRLFSSSLVAVVTLAAPRKLIVCHYKKGTEICNYSYSNTILAVKLNRSRLIVCLEESLHIHNIRDMKILHTIRDTPPNPRGICALSPSVDHCYVAYPGSSATGEVQIFDAVHLNAKCVIPAHDSTLAALAFSSSGTRLATASERGTVIRVFSVPERAKLFEFRRGVKRCVTIASLSFSGCGLYLAASSNTETVHIFRLAEPSLDGPDEEEAAAAGWMGWLSSAVSAGAGLLPAHVSGVLQQGRAFAAARLPCSGARSATAVTVVAKQIRVMVATAQGVLYVYALDPVEGGECNLVKHHQFIDPSQLSTSIAPRDPHEKGAGSEGSYAGALRGRDPAVMTDSERASELGAALQVAPSPGPFDLGDHKHFPPMKHAP